MVSVDWGWLADLHTTTRNDPEVIKVLVEHENGWKPDKVPPQSPSPISSETKSGHTVTRTKKIMRAGRSARARRVCYKNVTVSNINNVTYALLNRNQHCVHNGEPSRRTTSCPPWENFKEHCRKNTAHPFTRDHLTMLYSLNAPKLFWNWTIAWRYIDLFSLLR